TKPDVVLHPITQQYSRSDFRCTDLAVLENELIWGTDDILVAHEHFDINATPPMLARMYRSRRLDILQPFELGICGQACRSIVDVGKGYLAFSEAKYLPLGLEPKVFFVDKNPPHSVQFLFSVPNQRNIATGFSYSRASKAAVKG